MAANSLGGRNGAVVFLDPVTGEVLTLVSSPAFDPNLLSSPNTTSANNARTDLLNQPEFRCRTKSLAFIKYFEHNFILPNLFLQLLQALKLLFYGVGRVKIAKANTSMRLNLSCKSSLF